jgi:hypothetical protein
MRLPLAIAATLLFATSSSANPAQQTDKVLIGTGVICDTPEQAQRFVTLRNGGNETMQALLVINKEAGNPTACGSAMVAFKPVEPVQNNATPGKPVDVIKIAVVAYNDGRNWSVVPETVQYAVVAPQGIEA